ncbi:MAG TPA: hypothetical protein VJX67_22340 [Blastocatellia bacterium]|nr:hypothetical protein [Blastocatellia bacterium]
MSVRLTRFGYGVLSALVLSVSSAGALAQEPVHYTSVAPGGFSGDPRIVVPELLKSTISENRAWGAYLVGQHHLDDFVPSLIEELRAEAEASSHMDWPLERSVLDSLIQLDAKLPPDLFRPLLDHFRAEAIILASNSPVDHQAELLALMRQPLSDSEWLAAGNMLAEVTAPRFAATLLGDIRVDVSVFVVDLDDGSGWGAGSHIGYSVACGAAGAPTPAGYPPLAYYELTTGAKHGSVALGPGPHPVYYVRSATPPGGSGGSSSNRDSYRIEYLAEMLNTGVDGLHFRLTSSQTIRWQGAVAFERELTRLRQAAHNSYQGLADRLVAAGLATQDQIPAPNISISVTDKRGTGSTPLPSRD